MDRLCCPQELQMQIAHLHAANADLLKDKEEALPLLEAYRSDLNQLCMPCFCFCEVISAQSEYLIKHSCKACHACGLAA